MWSQEHNKSLDPLGPGIPFDYNSLGKIYIWLHPSMILPFLSFAPFFFFIPSCRLSAPTMIQFRVNPSIVPQDCRFCQKSQTGCGKHDNESSFYKQKKKRKYGKETEAERRKETTCKSSKNKNNNEKQAKKEQKQVENE